MKENILRSLRRKKFVSGSELANQLDVSKVTIWKHIQSLKEDGYQIEARPGEGYHLQSSPEVLAPYEIKSKLETEFIGENISHYEEVPSTQTIGKRLARNGAKEGTVVIADSQTTGKGRKSREWFSPEGGLYASIILRPDISPPQAPIMSLLMGVAAAKSIRKINDLEIGLKWPNDIRTNEKKVGGILLEMSAETDQIKWLVVGIGLNVNNKLSFSAEDVKSRATSLKEEIGENISRLNLSINLLRIIEETYLTFKKEGAEPILKKWKNLSSTLGSAVHISDGEEIEGKAVDIDSDGALVLELEDGSRTRIIAGDVSLRKKS